MCFDIISCGSFNANQESNGYINGSQLAKMKKSIPDMSCHKMYRDEAVGLKNFKI